MNNLKILYSGKYLNMVEKDGWEYITRNNKDVVVIMPSFGDSILLIDEFRKPFGLRIIGLPAGLVDPGEDIYTAAKRELIEETGYEAGKIECVSSDSPSSSGMTNETFNMMVATDLKRVGPGGGDESEDINIIIVKNEDIRNRIQKYKTDGFLIDPKIFMGLYFLNFRY